MLEALPPLPDTEAPRPVAFPKPVVTVLPNGLEVIVLEDHEVPTAEVFLAARAGSIFSPAESPALAQLTAGLLSEGTTKHRKADIDQRMDATGGSLDGGAGNELARLHASVMAADLGLALELMAEEVVSPAFPEEAIAKLKDQLVQGERSQKADPGTVAGRLAARVVYGADSPYGRPFMTEEQIQGATREAIVAFHRAHWLPNRAMLVVVGDVDATKVAKLAKARFGAWKRGAEVPAPVAAPAPAPSRPLVHIVDRPASAQATVVVTYAAPRIGTQAWFETQILTEVLSGGTLTTRLNLVLREQLGLTYGAYANHAWGFDGGLFVAGGGTKTKTAGEFARALLPLVLDLGKTPLGERDLARVKSMVSGSFALEAEKALVAGGKTLEQRLYGLPENFWANYRRDVEAVGSSTLHEVARGLFAPERLQIIAVGKRKKLEEQLQDLGEIRLWDADLRPVTLTGK
jgi:zinc protease